MHSALTLLEPAHRVTRAQLPAACLITLMGLSLAGCSTCSNEVGASAVAKFSVETTTSAVLQLQVCRSKSCVTSGETSGEDTGVRVEKNGPSLWTIAFIDSGAPKTFEWNVLDESGKPVAHGDSSPTWSSGCSSTASVRVADL